jgi:solute carrier family 10 (sodium/bile acid cotransporter), member 7
VTPMTFALLLAAVSFLLLFAFCAAAGLGDALKLRRADRISLLFAGAHKSIATGAPMAAILFGADAGLILLPAIVYHIAQLLVSAPLAGRLAGNSGKM